MARRSITRSVLSVVAAVVISLTTLQLGPANAVPSYPTWSEVQAAKRKVAAKKALIAKIEAYIQDLNKEADRLGKISLVKGEAYNVAQSAVDVVQVKVDSLQGQVDQASALADQAQMQLGQIASQMYRDGAAGTSMKLFLNSQKAGDLLYQLGTQNKIAQQSDTIYQRAVAKQRLAQSLADQLVVAKNELAAKAKVAKAAYKEAQAATNAVQANLNQNNELNKTFYAQLATLRKSSTELERQRAEGLAQEARQNAGSAGPDAPWLYSVGDPNSAKVERMISYAKAQLGKPYIFGAAGPNAFDCSGLTMKAYKAAGVYIGWHSAVAQYDTMAYQRKLVPIRDRQRGDLLFFSTSQTNSDRIYHIVIYLGDNMILEAANPARPIRIINIRFGEMFPYGARPTA